MILVLKAKFFLLPPSLPLSSASGELGACLGSCTHLESHGLLHDDDINPNKGSFLLRNLGMCVTWSLEFLLRKISVTVTGRRN